MPRRQPVCAYALGALFAVIGPPWALAQVSTSHPPLRTPDFRIVRVGAQGSACIDDESLERPSGELGIGAVAAPSDSEPAPACIDLGHARSSTAAPPRFRGVPLPCKVVELVADADYPFFQHHLSSVPAVVADIEAVLLAVNAIYGAAPFDPPVRFALKQVTVRTTPDEPYAPVPLTGGDYLQFLDLIGQTWGATPSPTRDVVHVFTGRTFPVAVGVASGPACVGNPFSNEAASFVSSTLFQTPARRATLSAHELGHNLGLSHDGVEGFIMNPSLSKATVFSPQSIAQYHSGFGSQPNCLDNVPPDALPDVAYTTPGQAVLVDVLANDSQALTCQSAVASFSLGASGTSAGGSVAISIGSGPGGRDQVLYSPPPVGPADLEDSFAYTPAGSSIQVPVSVRVLVPRPPHPPIAPDHPGLAGAYYPFTDWQHQFPDFGALDRAAIGEAAQIDFPLSADSSAGTGDSTNLAAVFTGFLDVPATGLWTHWLHSDNLSRLYIDDQLVISNLSDDQSESPSLEADEIAGTIALQAGKHGVRIEYAQSDGNALLRWSWSGPGVAKQIVPPGVLSNTACRADINGNGSVTVQDLFDYLRLYLSGCCGGAGSPCNGRTADINGSVLPDITTEDLRAFLSLWFARCP